MLLTFFWLCCCDGSGPQLGWNRHESQRTLAFWHLVSWTW